MKMHRKRCPIVAAVLACVMLAMVTAQSCPDGYERCTCNKGTLICKDLPQLPPTLPADVVELECNMCDLTAQITTGYMFPEAYAPLKKLILVDSMIGPLPDNVFSKLTNLEVLDLSGNSLRRLSKEILNGLSNLKQLILETSNVTIIGDGTFSNSQNMEKLDLSANKLPFTDTMFTGLGNLQVLALKWCYFTEVPIGSFSPMLNSLTRLDLDHNHELSELRDDGFSSLKNLQQLSLDSCKIKQITDKTFSGLGQLRVLNIGHNELKSIPANSFQASKAKLEELYVDGNQLTALPSDLLDWSVVKKVRFVHNPWNCDCGIGWINKIDLPHLDHENVTCSSPAELKDHSVINATSGLDCPCPKCGGSGGGSNAVALGIAIPIIIIAVLLISYYIYKICVKRGQKRKKDVRYSSVYKPTTETAKPDTHKPLV